MPQITEIDHSDEEYQDAENVPVQATPDTTPTCTATPPTDIVDEIIKQQSELNLNGGDADFKDADSKCDDNKEAPAAEYLHDDVDEEALKKSEMSMTTEELEVNKEKANTMKLEANELFKNNDCEKAIDVYTDALKMCPLSCNKERAILYGNRAAAKIKIDSKKSALDDCNKSVELWPDYVRVLLR